MLALFLPAIVPADRLRAQVAPQDSLALVALYEATNGATWTDHTNWLTGRWPTGTA